MKRLASLVLMLGCVSAYAKDSDEEVWITLGSDALAEVSASFLVGGQSVPAIVAQKGGVTALKVRESDLVEISRTMHEKLNRCGGFVYHETEAAALAAVADSGQARFAAPLAVSYTLSNGPVVNALLANMAEPNIRATIAHLSNYPNRFHTSASGVEAAQWLKSQWETYAAGRADVTVQLFSHAAFAQPSVILTIQGRTTPSEIVVVGGHLDSLSSGSTAPGADDDASGIATISEVIRVAMATGYQPEKTVKFMAYAAEEVGLRGSTEIANAHKNQGANVIGVLQLDMTNYKGSLADVGIISDFTDAAQNNFVTRLIDTYVTDVSWQASRCNYGCSDHAAWTNAGFAASMPFESLMGEHNGAIHTAGDTLAVSNNNAMHALKFAKIAGAYMAELAKGTVTLSDTILPTVSLTAPLNASNVSGAVVLSADATDNQGISRVEFLVDGRVVGTSTAPPYAATWDSATTANGIHSVVARAFDLVGNSASSAAVTVTSTHATGYAAYDSVLKVPRCSIVGNTCDSTTLLNGRAGLGPEARAPNTINNSCADGRSGAYHSDESNDRIKVSTVSGAPFARGQQVRVEATVWVYSTREDKLDLYYAANALSPVWTKLSTLTPAATGSQTLAATYTLPTGALQAVRARFRFNGSAAACGTGAYDDHDDIVFAVNP